MAEYRKNLANAIVGTMTPSTSATSIPLQAGYGTTMPAVPFFMTYTPPGQLSTQGNSEIVLVSAISTDTLTVVRAQKGTTAKSIGTGWICSASILRETSLAVGDIISTLNSTPQTGRVFMAGQTLNKADYPLLYDHVVNNSGYGTTTSTTFTLKDMSGRVPAAKAASGAFSTLGSTLGQTGITMTQNMLVGHWHSIWLNTNHGDGTPTSYESLNTPLQGGGRARYRGGTGQALNGNTFQGQDEVSGSVRSTPVDQIPTVQPTIIVNYEVVAS